ncbi:MAG: sn-glycerol-3-phosphate ABC transporter ATP-binding protein UgpC [Bacteroidales bacterium]|nr:sn-glycerol-3-phosphate ABC transporter ATP-binding protein UgpC [Bacteroidales bacterium]
MADVKLNNIDKSYDGKTNVVKNVNVEIKDKEFAVLVGPSGCGKSTILRMVAGLENITGGDLLIDGNRVNDLLPKNRDIAMVFQNYALYPHMTVYQNMAFGLKLKKVPKKEIDQRVKKAAQILEIEELLDRKPKAMSGGQRQRVAIGRAIVRNPKVFLFDEPLSNLDAKLRVQMRVELQKLHKKLQATIIYVTHDQTEAMTLGDRIIVLNDGVVMQIGAPMELYNKPDNMFVAGFIGSPPVNFIQGEIRRAGSLNFIHEKSGLKIELSELDNKAISGFEGKKVILGIRPEDIYSKPQTNSGHFAKLKTTSVAIEQMGSEMLVYVVLDDKQLIARFSPESKLETGKPVDLFLDTNKIIFFDPDTEQVI